MTGDPGPACPGNPALDALWAATDHRGMSAGRWVVDLLARLSGPAVRIESDRPGRATGTGTGVGLSVLAVSREDSARAGSVLAHAGALPLQAGSAGVIGVVTCLPQIGPLHEFFAELRRVLRPAGTLVVLVPCRPRTGRAAPGSPWRAMGAAMGGLPRFRHEVARDQLSWLVNAADFAVLADQRRTFRLPVPDGAAAAVVAALPAAGIWPPLDRDRRATAADALASRAGPRCRLTLPMRLVVARR